MGTLVPVPSPVLSVVVPVYNEERSVELLYDEVASALDPLERAWEVVFVDDGSTDGSFARPHPVARTRAERAGRPAAPELRQGRRARRRLRAGAGDVVVTIDADRQDDPAEIPRLLAKLDEGSTSSPAGRRAVATRGAGGSCRGCSTPSRAGSPACACTT